MTSEVEVSEKGALNSDTIARMRQNERPKLNPYTEIKMDVNTFYMGKTNKRKGGRRISAVKK